MMMMMTKDGEKDQNQGPKENIIAESVNVGIEYIMKNHVYSFMVS